MELRSVGYISPECCSEINDDLDRLDKAPVIVEVAARMNISRRRLSKGRASTAGDAFQLAPGIGGKQSPLDDSDSGSFG